MLCHLVSTGFWFYGWPDGVLNDFTSLNCTLYVGCLFVFASFVFQRDRSNHIVSQAMQKMPARVRCSAYLCFSEIRGGHVVDFFVWQVWFRPGDPRNNLGEGQWCSLFFCTG
jgi:hypothetical protein